ncbi:hypothetical protein [Kitasatospora sp. NPDC001175]|uniref:hypothetical protein n=1 Tax=Kitasatospora sp. NPDC001175 TaxID=3157103 RepID=UPI003D03FAA2
MTTPQERPATETVPEPDRTMRLDRPSPPDPAAAATVRLASADVRGVGEDVELDAVATVELEPSAAAATVRLASADVRAVGEDVELDAVATVELEPSAAAATVRLASADVRAVGEEAESATLLDEEAWATPAATVELSAATVELSAATVETTAEAPLEATLEATVPAPAGSSEPTGEPRADGLRRFGPGVPSATADVPALAAAVWHGTARPGEPAAAEAPRPARRRLGWLLPLLVLLAVLGYLAWQGSAQPLSVTAVSVRADPAGPSCDGTATVIGTLRTKGRAGTVSYRWRRSDGTVSAEIAQPVPKGSHQTDVVLRWTFEGKGTMAATATLEVLSPDSRTASASFTYTCH